ncbi:SDR family NAD(P)-dependent oxidoreductase [Burkholderia sp. L27(2015)]|uniref:SDR family NAD(P)-dependent oxidoreductase n=1 Tax=Burkholderia sp. L27(2015) TaxID=1641858 RepID=UPI00131E2B1C|nr:SDR family NAD(P)-dependent oxidoreductase [Burkholderia sp. L27(2015)]
MKDFAGKVAVITGAAGGLGMALVGQAAKRGMKLVLADVDRQALAANVESLHAQGVEAIGIVTDVSDPAQLDALAAATLDAFGAIHLLFNNAGVGAGGFVWENTANDWQWVWGVNVLGVVNGLRAFVPHMLKQGEPAHIVNTASVAGLLAPAMLGLYNATKHAVIGLSETLYNDLKMTGAPVQCSVLCPAFFDTGIASSDRTRPPELQNDTALTASQRVASAQLRKAVKAGKLSAEQVAEKTFDAIGAGQFYILTHAAAKPAIELRLEDLALERNPSDPYTYKPDVKPH